MMIVVKRDAHGREVTRYSVEAVIEQNEDGICLRAIFQRPQIIVGSLTLAPGDIFTEWFYTSCWYNVFRVQDGVTPEGKGWYCNFTRPAEISAESVVADDLELDLVITPAWQIQLLDLREYLSLDLGPDERLSVAAAYRQICALVAARKGPFEPPL